MPESTIKPISQYEEDVWNFYNGNANGEMENYFYLSEDDLLEGQYESYYYYENSEEDWDEEETLTDVESEGDWDAEMEEASPTESIDQSPAEDETSTKS